MSGDDAAELQQRIVAFVRAFGLHRPDETPCGAPVPVSEAHALTVLAQHGPLPQNRLAQHLALTKSTVSRLVDQLARRGWVARRRADGDGRQRLVELTDDGRTTAQAIAARRAERIGGVLQRIPHTDRATVLAALDLLVAASRDT